MLNYNQLNIYNTFLGMESPSFPTSEMNRNTPMPDKVST